MVCSCSVCADIGAALAAASRGGGESPATRGEVVRSAAMDMDPVVCERVAAALEALGVDVDGDAASEGPREHRLRGFVMPVSGLSYAVQLAVKMQAELQANWPRLESERVHVVASPVRSHRLRLKFFVGRSGSDGPHRLGISNTDPEDPRRTAFIIDGDFPIATERMQRAMRALLASLDAPGGSEIPSAESLHVVNFVDTMDGQDFVVTLYHLSPSESKDEQGSSGQEDAKMTTETWSTVMQKGLLARLAQVLEGRVTAVWRSRKCVRTASLGQRSGLDVGGDLDSPDEGEARVLETGLFPGRRLCQVEGSFSNPNGAITRGVNDWLHATLKGCGVANARLLELCSGCGNHTVGLADLFARVVCVEIDPHLVKQARRNLALNGLDHVQVFCDDMRRLPRILRRAARGGWDAAEGPTVCLVDPPRRGLPDELASFVGELDSVDFLVYVACGDGLERNAAALAANFELQELCFADHFPYTHFIEKVAVFARRGRVSPSTMVVTSE
ncbi:tRNA uracil54-C5-methyltransferase [Hondaea fermentalgiana]|uniref:tRNA uracil54-C5-methyltransferase n=1 Tax=Hondaea fermentalgiana TaxID=2315210 RepID=A0A2R5GW50_9STRA|nr:tRNA uracil54-C5-methyltransferase [Hondaea fermentalgiana]|eukprot:GBG32164.1 tRNA uracil54-C5-methyltransferase [Hondaea fermentalgiana]